MAVVGMTELILVELDVELVVLFDPDRPNAVDGRVIREAVLPAVFSDVSRANKVLKLKLF